MFNLNSLFSPVLDFFSRSGPFGLFLLAFTEASFNPIPIEILFIPMILARPDLVYFLVALVAVGSTLGGILGYYIGYIGKVAVLERFFSAQKIERAHKLFKDYEAWAVFAGGFTPLPYKVVTIGAGVFNVSLKKFVLAAFIGRLLRFSLEALFLILFGNAVLSYLQTSIGLISILLTLVVAGTYFYVRRRRRRRRLIFHE